MILPPPYTLEAVIIQTWVFVAAFLGALIVHEYAHAEALRSLGKKPIVWYQKGLGINVGFPKDYEGLTKKQKLYVYSAGILWGAAFIVLPLSWLYPSFAVGLFIIYFVGCKHDIKQIWGLYR